MPRVLVLVLESGVFVLVLVSCVLGTSLAITNVLMMSKKSMIAVKAVQLYYYYNGNVK